MNSISLQLMRGFGGAGRCGFPARFYASTHRGESAGRAAYSRIPIGAAKRGGAYAVDRDKPELLREPSGSPSGNNKGEDIIVQHRKTFLAAALCASAFMRPCRAQVAPTAVLELDAENVVRYYEDTADPTKFATVPDITPAA